MRRDLQRWRVVLWREHRVLALLLCSLLLRLLVHGDHHFTIRDADFFPADLDLRGGRQFRGGRFIPLLLSHVWGFLSGGEPFLAKQIAGKIQLVIATPAFVLLGLRARLDARTIGFGAALFLGNAQLFGLYDNLGPYFLLVAVVLWQVLAALEARDDPARGLARYFLISCVALLSHRTGMVTTFLTAGILFFGPGRRRLDARAWLMNGIFAALSVGKVIMLTRFDALEKAHQTEVYSRGILSSVEWTVAPVPASIGEGLLTLFPGWGGVLWDQPLYLGAATLLLIGGGVLGWIGLRRELRWLSVMALAAAAALVVATEAATAESFFKPNHATYSFVWMPIFVLLLGRALAERLPRWVGGAALVLLLGVNLWQGAGFRQQSFDFNRYERFVLAERWAAEVPHRLVPAFLGNEFARLFQPGSHLRPYVQQEATHNDFTTLHQREFVIDVITYDELGLPLYRYRAYLHHLREWAASQGLTVTCRPFQTFTSCHVLPTATGSAP